MPALQSLIARQVGPDKQGQLQGVLASLVSLAAVFGPLFFSSLYFGIRESWPGADLDYRRGGLSFRGTFDAENAAPRRDSSLAGG